MDLCTFSIGGIETRGVFELIERIHFRLLVTARDLGKAVIEKAARRPAGLTPAVYSS